MISLEYIEALEEQTKEARKAAEKFVTRSQQPEFKNRSDRFASSQELHLVAQGIIADREIIGMYVMLVEQLVSERERAGIDAMRLHTGDSKYAQKREQ